MLMNGVTYPSGAALDCGSSVMTWKEVKETLFCCYWCITDHAIGVEHWCGKTIAMSSCQPGSFCEGEQV